ncbi:MAG: HDOD domain-containing protein [Sulfuricellaceae bacterium]|nr:HDOD domain-containing protein [Sulfuricellaceae bacterium]
MSPELEQKLAAAVEKMPAFPKSVQKILELTRDSNCEPKDLVQVIEKDPVITVKVLKVLNSAYYSLPKKITSINQSVVYLGFNTIKNMALSITAIGILPKRNEAGFDVQQYLLHSLTTAAIAKKLAERFDDTDPMDSYIAGLLHDFGKVVFAQFMPEEFKTALEESRQSATPLHRVLHRSIGADHTVVGSMLAEKWQFSPHLIAAIRHHHSPLLNDGNLMACVFAANEISKKMEFGFSGNPCVEELPSTLAARLGGSLDEVIASLGDLTPLYDEAKLYSQVENGE